MLVRCHKRLLPIAATVIILSLLFVRFYYYDALLGGEPSLSSIIPPSILSSTSTQDQHHQQQVDDSKKEHSHVVPQQEQQQSQPILPEKAQEDSLNKTSQQGQEAEKDVPPQELHILPFQGEKESEQDHDIPSSTHTVLSSLTTSDGSYFRITFGDHFALNPNIIPHPHLPQTYLIIAQEKESNVKQTIWHAELVCAATFQQQQNQPNQNITSLSCLQPPSILPIAATPSGGLCGEDKYGFDNSIGPHDARVFYGPKAPFTIYGSNSQLTCFGMFMLDFRLLVDWGLEGFNQSEFRQATELQRPAAQEGGGKYFYVEKNWFVFWDREGQKYIHHDSAPKRVFAKLADDGSVGEDLAPLAATSASESTCLAKLMPKIASPASPDAESIHQATNSLAITLCERNDEACKTKANGETFIFHIFQHKKYYRFHSTYEPYVMAFRDVAPFAVYGISGKPIWIKGRRQHRLKEKKEGEKKDKLRRRELEVPVKREEVVEEDGQSEMFYITSMSWKSSEQKYHGYLDDVLFIAFGIEDKETGGIDIKAGDLFKDLSLCA